MTEVGLFPVPLARLASMLGRKPETIRSAVSRGSFPIVPTRIYGRVYFAAEDVRRLMAGELDRQPARGRKGRAG